VYPRSYKRSTSRWRGDWALFPVGFQRCHFTPISGWRNSHNSAYSQRCFARKFRKGAVLVRIKLPCRHKCRCMRYRLSRWAIHQIREGECCRCILQFPIKIAFKYGFRGHISLRHRRRKCGYPSPPQPPAPRRRDRLNMKLNTFGNQLLESELIKLFLA
jgi:hypothetical protein